MGELGGKAVGGGREGGKLDLKSLAPRWGSKMIKTRYKETLHTAVPTVKQNLNFSWLLKIDLPLCCTLCLALDFSFVR